MERRRRIVRALFAVVMEAYVHGISTRKVDDLVQALGVGSGISKSEVSRICAQLDGDVEAFRNKDAFAAGSELTSPGHRLSPMKGTLAVTGDPWPTNSSTPTLSRSFLA